MVEDSATDRDRVMDPDKARVIRAIVPAMAAIAALDAVLQAVAADASADGEQFTIYN